MVLLKKFELEKIQESERQKEVEKIFDGSRRQILVVTLRNGAVLSKHKAQEPITVLCLAGNGKFFFGSNLEEETELSAGVLLTLEAGIEHEAVAAPELKILVTKFKEN